MLAHTLCVACNGLAGVGTRYVLRVMDWPPVCARLPFLHSATNKRLGITHAVCCEYE